MDEFILCYVRDDEAFFTSQTLEEQWGDDWDDAPYEYNAGTPYTWQKGRGHPYEIVKVKWQGPWEDWATKTYHCAEFAVQDFNDQLAAWLVPHKRGNPPIYAGITLRSFKELIATYGGSCGPEEVF